MVRTIQCNGVPITLNTGNLTIYVDHKPMVYAPLPALYRDWNKVLRHRPTN